MANKTCKIGGLVRAQDACECCRRTTNSAVGRVGALVQSGFSALAQILDGLEEPKGTQDTSDPIWIVPQFTTMKSGAVLETGFEIKRMDAKSAGGVGATFLIGAAVLWRIAERGAFSEALGMASNIEYMARKTVRNKALDDCAECVERAVLKGNKPHRVYRPAGSYLTRKG